MIDLDRRGRRVAGFFLFMLGAGLVLETRASWYGTAMMGLGLLCFLAGALPRGPGAPS